MNNLLFSSEKLELDLAIIIVIIIIISQLYVGLFPLTSFSCYLGFHEFFWVAGIQKLLGFGSQFLVDRNYKT